MKRTLNEDEKEQIVREFYLIEKHFLTKIKYYPEFTKLPSSVKKMALGNITDLNTVKPKAKPSAIFYTVSTDLERLTSTMIESEHKIRSMVDGIEIETPFVAAIDNKPEIKSYPVHPKRATKAVRKIDKCESTKAKHLEDEGAEDCIFIRILDRYLFRHLAKYEIFIDNAVDDNFDLIYDFIKSFERNCFEHVFYKTQSAAFDKRNYEIATFDESLYLTGDTEMRENEIALSTEPLPDMPAEQYPNRERATAKLNSLRVDFDKYLNFVEHKIFMNMIKRTLTYSELSTVIGPRMHGELLTEQKIRTILNKIQFRFNCFMILRKFLNPELGLHYLNEMPRLCNKYFRNHMLSVLPTDERLRFVVEDDYVPAGDMPRPTYSCMEIESAMQNARLAPFISTHGRDFLYSSCTDFNGKVHKHAVVYVKASGWAYDHVTGECKDLMRHDREDEAA